jgi:hypothetical protein
MKHKKFYDELYKSVVYAVYGTADECEKWVKKKFNQELNIDRFWQASCVELLENEGYVVWLEDNKNFYALLHECVHLTGRILKNMDVNKDLIKNDEHIAYYLEFWFRKLWRFFGNLKK